MNTLLLQCICRLRWHYPEVADTTRLRRLSENKPDLRREGPEIDVADPSETSGPRFCCDAQRGISYCDVVGFKLNPRCEDHIAPW